MSGESRLSRWSRRKLEAEQESASVEQAPTVEATASLNEPVVDEIEAPAPLLTDADMPDIESLTEESDYSGFMSSGVSDELRNLALRKLFRAPVFNIRDGLDEYDEDYTYFEKLGDIVTCDMKHQIEMQEQKLREALANEDEASEEAELEGVEAIDDEDEAVIEDEDEAIIETGDDVNRPGQAVAAAADENKPAARTDDE
jgi:hypothetical protein